MDHGGHDHTLLYVREITCKANKPETIYSAYLGIEPRPG